MDGDLVDAGASSARGCRALRRQQPGPERRRSIRRLGCAGSGAPVPSRRLVLLPVAPLDAFAIRQRLPRAARASTMRSSSKKWKARSKSSASSRQMPSASAMLRAPLAARPLAAMQDRLIGIARAACAGVRQEAVRPHSPQQLVERARCRARSATISKPPAARQHALGDARQHPLERRRGELVEVDLHRAAPLSAHHRSRNVSRDEPIEQAHAIAGRALVPGRAGLVRPDHAGDVEMRPAARRPRRSA